MVLCSNLHAIQLEALQHGTPVYHHATPFHRNSLDGLRILEPSGHHYALAMDRVQSDREPMSSFNKQSQMHKNEYYNSQVRVASSSAPVHAEMSSETTPTSHQAPSGGGVPSHSGANAHQRTPAPEQRNMHALAGSLESLTTHDVSKSQPATSSNARMSDPEHGNSGDYALPPRQFSNTSRYRIIIYIRVFIKCNSSEALST